MTWRFAKYHNPIMSRINKRSYKLLVAGLTFYNHSKLKGYGSSNGAKFSRFYYMYSVLSHLYSVSSYLYSVTSSIYSVSCYFIQSSFLYSVSHIVKEDIVPHILSCSRFRNNQTELRKRQIQKCNNTENRILNSNKNIAEKTETWKTLEELHSL